jgi:uncharacterized membrane protein required for colicin V production
MYWLDTAILAVLALATVLGARTGLVRQVARLVALGVALYGSIRLHESVVTLLGQSVLPDAPSWAVEAAAYGGVFLLIYVALYSLALFLDRGVRAAQARWLDRTLGAAFGAAKAGAILGVIFLGLAAFAPGLSQDVAERSALVPRLTAAVQGAFNALPEQYRESLLAQLRAAVGGDD